MLEGQPRLPSTPAKKPLLPRAPPRTLSMPLLPLLPCWALGLLVAAAAPPPPYTRIEREAAPQLTIIPKRHRTCAQACVRKGEGYVYAQHLRKAGGTLLRTYLAMYRCAPLQKAMTATQLYRLPRGEPRQGTAPAAAQESLAFNTQNFVLRPATVYITLIRHPVDRIESLYFFEGKWPQKSYRRTEDTAISLQKWLRKVEATSRRRAWGSNNHLKQRGAYPLRQRIWDEVSEYYVQIFSGVAAEATAKHLEVAKSVLDNFDAVLILERLSTEEGRSEAEALLRKILPLHNVECPPRLPLHKVNEGSVRKRAEPLSREDRLRIVALNPLDLELYRHAVSLHKERIEEVLGPCRVRTNCTSVRDRDLNLIWGEGALRSCGRMVYRSGRAGCRA